MQDEIRNKIKKITIYTKRIMQSTLAGDYISAFKGSGLEFDQIREYQINDDIRFIDWNNSAKMNKIMVKQFIEERDRTIILTIDVSASSNFSSTKELRKETIAQVATALAFIANNNKDKVGALFFSDRIEKWIAPNRSKTNYSKIIETLFSLQPKGQKTDIQTALRFLVGLKKRNAILFILSDWIDEINNYSSLLKLASLKYDLIGIRFQDKCEKKMPNIGFLQIIDPETKATTLINTKTQKYHKLNDINTYLKTYYDKQKKLFEKYKIDSLDLTVGKSFINQMIQFFHKRIKRQI